MRKKIYLYIAFIVTAWAFFGIGSLYQHAQSIECDLAFRITRLNLLQNIAQKTNHASVNAEDIQFLINLETTSIKNLSHISSPSILEYVFAAVLGPFTFSEYNDFCRSNLNSLNTTSPSSAVTSPPSH